MFKMYFKISRRNLMKNKVYSAINILGLAVGLAAFTIISLFVYDELNYDRHFKGFNHIYRIAGEYHQGGDARIRSALTTYMLQPFLQANFDNEVVYTRLDFRDALIHVGDRDFWESEVLAVDSTFFEAFGLELIVGSPLNALDKPGNVVLDKSTARKYFPYEGAVGKSIEVEGEIFEVSGVIPDLPANTHFSGSIFIPIHGISDRYPDWIKQNPTGTSHLTYFRSPDDMDVKQFETDLNNYISSIWRGDNPPQYFFQPIKDIHLQSNLAGEVGVNGSETVVYIFLATAIAILLLACINYVNLSIAGALQRSKEVGVKKVLGASKKSQVFQFQAEAILTGFVASAVAILLIELITPFFNAVSGKSIAFDAPDYLLIGLGLLVLTLFLSLATGSFPALFLLKIPAHESLGGARLNSNRDGFSIRNLLVSVQFFLAAVLIVSTLIITQQLHFMQNKDLGVESHNIVIIPFQNFEVLSKYPAMKEELLRNSAVMEVSAASNKVTDRISMWRGYTVEGASEGISCPTVVVGYDFFKTLGARILEGRFFSEDYSTDHTESYVLNEAAVKFFELEKAVGTGLQGAVFTGSKWSVKNAKIIGVVKDFHFASLHSEIRPAVFSLSSADTTPMSWILVKISGENIQETINFMESTWAKFGSGRPFHYEFMEDALKNHYQSEARFLKVLLTFSILSIFIGCLGLYGLTAFLMKRRIREIGIRKVFGATVVNLISELSKDFLGLVLLANIVGWPVAFWFMKTWLENFEYQIPLSAWPFIYTALGALLIAFLSIIYHSVKVARADPIQSIRHD